MKDKVNSVMGIGCYVVSLFFIGYYFFLAFSVASVVSPLERIKNIVFLVLFMYLGNFFLRKSYSIYKLSRFSLWVWFLLYLIMLFHLTLFDPYFGRSGGGFSLSNRIALQDYFKENFNLVPFATIQNYLFAFKNHHVLPTAFLYNIFGNLFAFMPLAFFFSVLFSKMDTSYRFFFFVSISVLFIESMQILLRCGSFDIDDYILNVMGAMLFYFFLHLSICKKFIKRFLYFQQE